MSVSVHRYRIRHAILGISAIPLLVLIVALAYDTYRQNRDDIADANRIATAIAERTAAYSEQFLMRAEHVLEGLAGRPGVRSLNPAGCDPLLAELKRLEPVYANIFTLDKDGRLVCSVIPSAPGQPVRLDPKFFLSELVRTRSFTVGKPVKGVITGRWVSTLAYPLQNGDGELIGAIGIAVDLASYRLLVSYSNLPPDTIVSIINGDGALIARSEDSANRVGTIVNSESAMLVLAQRQGTIRARGYGGTDRFFAFTPVPRSDWIATASFEASTVLGPARRLGWYRLALSIAIGTITLALVIFLTRRIAGPIETVSGAIATVRGGNLQARAVINGPFEIKQIADELNAMLDVRMRVEATMREQSKRLQDLAWQVMETEETERRRLANELHDRVGQSLSALIMNLRLIRATLPPASVAAISTRLDDTEALLQKTVQEVSGVMADLRPAELDDFGLLVALNAYAQTTGARAGFTVNVIGKDVDPRLPIGFETALYRIGQEALTNIAKYAQARHVELNLNVSAEKITLTIADDGAGFPACDAMSRRTGSRGLRVMQERAEAVGARLSIESAIGGGTRVAVSIDRMQPAIQSTTV